MPLGDESIQLAVASKDGISINQHFGHAKEFWIFEATDSRLRFLERRVVNHYCLGNHANQSAMTKILTTISDRAAVFTAKIGGGPAEKL